MFLSIQVAKIAILRSLRKDILLNLMAQRRLLCP